ncbi:hypothetical protein EYF80_003240 [Liparis tanakae]|uniref:Uncharacterized protein n=1 Tax=Liparis tanakae TaxID=230148 RepID=A0A4Z2J8P2_9TELE|nr:hypothetical protein EYF80_003240 [Liparis tanakae]
MAMAARTMRSLSWSPSVPTAMRELATEEGNSIALTVIIYGGRENHQRRKASKPQRRARGMRESDGTAEERHGEPGVVLNQLHSQACWQQHPSVEHQGEVGDDSPEEGNS